MTKQIDVYVECTNCCFDDEFTWEPDNNPSYVKMAIDNHELHKIHQKTYYGSKGCDDMQLLFDHQDAYKILSIQLERELLNGNVP